MVLINLNKRRRGQIRGVDFIVSLLLFLLMLSQLLLIIINVQYGLTKGVGTGLSYDELDALGRIILQTPGQSSWGYQNILPNSFGLATAENIPSLSLDAAKIARIITGTSFPVSAISGFEQFKYSSVKSILGLDSDRDFKLAFVPYLEPALTITETTTDFEFNVSVTVVNLNQKLIQNCPVYFLILDLTTGNLNVLSNKVTNVHGQAFVTYIDPHKDNPEGEHIIVAIAEKGPLWGVTWKYPFLIHPNILLGRESNATVWAGGTDPQTLLFSFAHESLVTPENHFLSYIYKNSQGDFSNQSIDILSTLIGNISISIPKDGIVVYFSTIKVGNAYKVGIGTYPAILDFNNDNGNFHSMFGKDSISIREKSRLTKDYPVYIRGTLMKCRITLWST
jgi:hypothetical protein